MGVFNAPSGVHPLIRERRRVDEIGHSPSAVTPAPGSRRRSHWRLAAQNRRHRRTSASFSLWHPLPAPWVICAAGRARAASGNLPRQPWAPNEVAEGTPREAERSVGPVLNRHARSVSPRSDIMSLESAYPGAPPVLRSLAKNVCCRFDSTGASSTETVSTRGTRRGLRSRSTDCNS